MFEFIVNALLKALKEMFTFPTWGAWTAEGAEKHTTACMYKHGLRVVAYRISSSGDLELEVGKA